MVKTNWKTKAKLFVLFAIGYVFFYIFPNFHPLFPPVMLPQTLLDRAMPFMPWTFMIYLSDYLFIGAAIAMLHGEEFYSFARQMFGALVLCGAFFMFVPTTYPRPPYPPSGSALIQLAMDMVAAGDMPTNCFPSMHVALTAICAWSLRSKSRLLYGIFMVWAWLIFLSTMTTKQHYCVDILGGIGVLVTMAVLDRSYVRRGISLKAWFSR